MKGNEPNKHPCLVKDMFNQIASRYDKVNRILSFGLDFRWRKKLAFYLPKQEKIHLLDLATGTADQLIALFETKKKAIHSAIGIDLAAEMVAMGEQKLRDKPYKDRIELQIGDMLHLPFEEASFDVCTLSFGIRNVQDPLRGLEEIHRVLKPEGRALILEFSLPHFFLLKWPYLLYLRHVLPWLGGKISQKPQAYRYLNRTIESFPSGDAFLALLKRSGFTKTSRHPIALGAATLYVGEKCSS